MSPLGGAPGIILNTSSRKDRIWLTALGSLSALVWIYVALAMPTSNRDEHVGLFLLVFAVLFVLYLAAAARLRRRGGPTRLAATILGFAVLFRLIAVLAGLPAGQLLPALRADLAGEGAGYEPFLLYDNDLWRYLWDGHVLAEGLNPYLVTPEQALEDEALEQRLLATEGWRDVHDGVSFSNYGTIYPPLTHLFFAALARIAPASAAAAKLALAAVDLLLCLLLWRLLAAVGARRELVLVYAWNPAVIKEFSASGHPDVLMMTLLVAAALALTRQPSKMATAAAGGIALSASVLAKLASATVLPLVAVWTWARHRREPRGGAVSTAAAVGLGAALLLGLWPFAGGLDEWRAAFAVFAERWTFNSGPWAATRWLFASLGAEEPARWAHLATRVLFVGLAVTAAAKLGQKAARTGDEREARQALFGGLFVTLAGLVLLSPAVMPWYVLWALPAAVVVGNRSWPVFTGLAFLSYLNYADGVGSAAWWKWIEYGSLTVVAAWEIRRGGKMGA